MGIKLNLLENRISGVLTDCSLAWSGHTFFLAFFVDWAFSRKARGLPIMRLAACARATIFLRLLVKRATVRRGSAGILASWLAGHAPAFAFVLPDQHHDFGHALHCAGPWPEHSRRHLAGAALVLGYVAFYAIGAYCYGLVELVNQAFGLQFGPALARGRYCGRSFWSGPGLSGTAAARRLSGHRHTWLLAKHCAPGSAESGQFPTGGPKGRQR